MRKTLFGIIAAGAIGLTACPAPQPEPQNEETQSKHSVAPLTTLQVLASKVYTQAANAPDGIYTLHVDKQFIGVKSKMAQAQGAIRAGDIEITTDGLTSKLFSDFGEDGTLNGYFTGKNVEGFVFYERHPSLDYQQEYEDLLLKIATTAEQKR